HSHADSRVHVSVSAHRAAGLRDAGSGVRARPAVRGAEIAEALYLVVPRPWRVSRGGHERNCRSPRRDAPRAVPPPHCALQRARRDLHDRCRRQTTGRLEAAAEGGPAVEVPRPRRRRAAQRTRATRAGRTSGKTTTPKELRFHYLYSPGTAGIIARSSRG